MINLRGKKTSINMKFQDFIREKENSGAPKVSSSLV
jgi:hypothetical protein